MIVTRLAPSPTGLLHLGNAWSFLLCWLYGRKNCGRVLLRMDDIDPQRSKPEFMAAIVRDLRWLGLDWDCHEGQEIILQSKRNDIYEQALAQLAPDTYPCFCTRREVRSLASAPHIGDEGVYYPGKCAALKPEERKALLASGRSWCLRLVCQADPVVFDDLIAGQRQYSKRAYGGDFALRRSDGVWAYQLASAADDADLGVNFVLRGRDLLPSTPRQIIIAAALGKQPPQYAHVPLLLDNEGNRLAKRHAALSLASLRAGGVSPEMIVGKLGQLAGCHPSGEPVSPGDLLASFSLARLPARDIALDASLFT